jgi:uracil-DNA glycosylase family 4
MPVNRLQELNKSIVRCHRCPRLVRWRETVAQVPPRRYRGQTYWAKPLSGFGDPEGQLLIVGLAPAAHGGNRTGRMFTGDRSGDWLFSALHAHGFSNRAHSDNREDGLRLENCYVTAAVRCAPPGNKPSRIEFSRCRPYLVRELELLANVRVAIALGRIAFDSFLSAYRENGGEVPSPRPKFGHGACVLLSDGLTLICSYHPSQQNTFTGKLTRASFDRIFKKAREVLRG